MSDGYRRRWETLERLFDAALDVPAESRLEWLEGLEWLDDELKEEARAMLAAHQRAEGVLERSVRSLAGEALAAREEAPGPRAGDRVGPYRVIGEAGRGGMGVVYRAHDERLERDVALKQLPARPDGFAAARRRFLREARSISSLDHPNLCTIHDLLELEDGRLFLAMAFYEGETLAEKLARGPVDPAEAVDYVLQAAAGLATAHEAGVVHRDIKPANLLVDRRGVLKILDFGVAQLGEGAPGERGGTPGYMAPEQWSGREVDRRADLWSLGVVLHELLVGERPFAAQDAESLIVAAAAGPPPLPETIAGADGMGRVLAGLLSVDPEDRPASAEEVLVRLGPYRDRRRLGRRRRPRLTAAVPEPPTPLIGREREIEWVEEALASSRLVTLTGPAGTGKTRLAIAVARRAVDRYRDGVAFVSLAALDAAELVAAEIAGQLGVGETAQRPPEESLTAALEGRRVLLVLDNFEQVVEAAALVARLLAACPGLTVLVTSRARLKLQGELARSVPPLERPRPGMDEAAGLATPAVRLFLDRARAADAAFGAEGRDVAAILAICRRLEGIPLAIELAAARVPLLGVAELSRRL